MNNLNMLAPAGDTNILPIVIGVVVVAFIVLVIALIVMLRKRK